MLENLRIALIWLVMLAIPAQGIAAATNLHCGSPAQLGSGTASNSKSHNAVAEVAPHEHSSAHSHATHQHNLAQAAGHDHHDHASLQSHPVSADGKHEHSAQSKCSACASCCSGAAITSSAIKLDGMTPVSMLVPFEYSSRLSFITDGPQRPPRSRLA